MSISLVIFQNNCSEVKCVCLSLFSDSRVVIIISDPCVCGRWPFSGSVWGPSTVSSLQLWPFSVEEHLLRYSSRSQFTFITAEQHVRNNTVHLSIVSARIRANGFTYSPPNRNINLFCPVVFIMQSYCKDLKNLFFTTVFQCRSKDIHTSTNIIWSFYCRSFYAS